MLACIATNILSWNHYCHQASNFHFVILLWRSMLSTYLWKLCMPYSRSFSPITYFPFLLPSYTFLRSSWKCAKQISVVPFGCGMCVCRWKLRLQNEEQKKGDENCEQEELSSSRKIFQPPGDSDTSFLAVGAFAPEHDFVVVVFSAPPESSLFSSRC